MKEADFNVNSNTDTLATKESNGMFDLTNEIDLCNINEEVHPDEEIKDNFFCPRHTFLPEIIKQNTELVDLTNSRNTGLPDIK